MDILYWWRHIWIFFRYSILVTNSNLQNIYWYSLSLYPFPQLCFFFVASKLGFIQYNNLENNKKGYYPIINVLVDSWYLCKKKLLDGILFTYFFKKNSGIYTVLVINQASWSIWWRFVHYFLFPFPFFVIAAFYLVPPKI